MKRFISLLILFQVGSSLYTQTSIDWQKSFGGTQDDYPDYVANEIVTSDGSYFLAGTSNSNDGNVSGSHGNEDFWVFKLNASGVLQWQKSYGGSQDEYASAFIQTSDNGFIIVGTTYSNDGNVTGNHGDYDIWVLKISSTGSIQWTKCFGGSDADYAYGVIQTIDGGYAIVGKTWSSDGNVTGYKGNGDAWMIKISSTGAFQWQKTYGGPGEDNAWHGQQSQDGSYIISGTTESATGDVSGNHGGFDVWLFKVDAAGNVQWKKCYGGKGDEYAYSFCNATGGGYVLTAETNSMDGDVIKNQGGYDFWIINVNSTGNLIWQKTYGGSLDDWACSIQPTNDGGYVIGGSTNSDDGDFGGSHGAWDFAILKISSTGNIVWKRLLGGSMDEEASTIQQTKEGGFIVCGYSYSNNGDASGNHGESDFWIVKLSANSTFVSQERSDFEMTLYPNPCNLSLRIDDLSEAFAEDGIYQILNLDGREIISCNYENVKSLEIDISWLREGTYILKLLNKNAVASNRFVKLDFN